MVIQCKLIDNFDSGNYIITDGQISPNENWKCIFNGFGTTGVHDIASPQNGRSGSCMYMVPQVNEESTSACLVLSERIFYDIDTTFYMRTIDQLRTPTGATWEVAWFMFRYTDSTHHYYMTIKTNNEIEVGKKDYDLIAGGIRTPDGVDHMGGQDQQAFLFTGGSLGFELGKWFKVRIVCGEGYAIKIWVDDNLIVDIVDDGSVGSMFSEPLPYGASSKMETGRAGFYVEDAEVEFDNFSIRCSK